MEERLNEIEKNEKMLKKCFEDYENNLLDKEEYFRKIFPLLEELKKLKNDLEDD